MNEKQIQSIVSSHRTSSGRRLAKLNRYYLGKHDVLLTSPASDPAGKPDNRLVCNFCRNITDSTVGYFMGKPVTYSVTGGGRTFEREIISICEYNDDQYVCSALAKDLSVYGTACELLWYDSDDQIRFAPLDPLQTIAVYGNTIDRELTHAIRMYKDKYSIGESGEMKDCTIYEVYDEREIHEYRFDGDTLILNSSREHGFSQVPVNFYYNNADAVGDFEPVISLIDAYNKLQSQSVNDFEVFADSYLAITGMGGTTSEDIEKLRRDRVLLLDDGGQAEWLTKQVNDVYVENLKDRISKDVFRFSSSIDMTDDSFSGMSPSGVSLRYRLLNFENRVSVCERYFKKALQRRWELVCEFLNKLGASYDWRDIRINFTRNLPFNLSDTADVLKSLDGVISRRTMLEQLPFVERVDDEITRIEEEQNNGRSA